MCSVKICSVFVCPKYANTQAMYSWRARQRRTLPLVRCHVQRFAIARSLRAHAPASDAIGSAWAEKEGRRRGDRSLEFRSRKPGLLLGSRRSECCTSPINIADSQANRPLLAQPLPRSSARARSKFDFVYCLPFGGTWATAAAVAARLPLRSSHSNRKIEPNCTISSS